MRYMNQRITKWLYVAVLLMGGQIGMNSCSHDSDKYEKKLYPVTDQERVSYAENVLGVSIDKDHDWVLTEEYSVKITADADLDYIVKIAVLDTNPYVDENYCLAAKAMNKGGSATLSFRAPKGAGMLYAACMTYDGKCIARPFVPGVDKSVSFVDENLLSARKVNQHRASAMNILEPQYTQFTMRDYYVFLKAVEKALPKGKNNSQVMGKHNYTNKVQVANNPYGLYSLPLAYIGGNGSVDDNLSYQWFPTGKPAESGETFLIKDNYPTGWDKEKEPDPFIDEYLIDGHYLYCRNSEDEISMIFTPGDIIKFCLARNEELLDDPDMARVKVFMLNGYVIVACEDGNDWDYNDRLFWMPYGAERLKEISDPIPPKTQVWTYAWEDKDFGDYDMNDCVIQVSENDAQDSLNITLVALGAKRELWLGFENKNAKNYNDYIHVFEQELHAVLNVSLGTMVNTGLASAKPVSITLKKPEGFDFQKCSFVLGARVEKDMRGVYESDFYAIPIAAKGQDPHGIVIPGKWNWPKETTCVKDAYPEFNSWSADRTKALNWYKRPEQGKVIVQ